MISPIYGARRALVATATALLYTYTASAWATDATEFQVAGLQQPAEILVDRWGIPHMYAQNLDDAFFVQGFNAARDRLWQIDFWRKRGLGKLAQTFGPAYVDNDRAARLFLYRGDMYREWLSYSSDAKRIAEAFTRGVNAYVEETRKNPDLLPVEFQQLGYLPELWQAEDIVRIRVHGLTRNAVSEIARARTACNADVTLDELRRGLQPPWRASVPDGLDPCTIPANVMEVYRLATAAIRFSPNPPDKAQAPDVNTMLAVLDENAKAMGSNNWAVSAARTTTGRPILANDPHRSHSAPSLRYIAHVSAPSLDVIGAGEPFLPGISIGHNGTIAFGLTIFSIDQEDVYFYETNPQNPDEYRYQGHWEPMTVLRETIEVKDEDSRTVELRFTRHGPVVLQEPDKNRAYALRVAWLDDGMAPYFGSVDFIRARNWDQFTAAMNRWGAPSENQVYADTAGNIGWVPGGLTPIRPNWDGLLPVPGDGRYEWAGYRHNDELPREYNPERGWVATANALGLPPGYPAENKVGFEWADPARITRITEVFNQGAPVSLIDSMALQNDVVSTHAKQLVPLIKALDSPDPDVRRAVTLLSGWNLHVSKDSAAAALYEVWFSLHLRRAVIERLAPAEKQALLGDGDTHVLIELLRNPDGRWGSDPVAARRQVLESSLKDAMADASKLLGADMSTWQWGRLHHAMFVHPLDALLEQGTGASVGPVSKSGDGFTVNASRYRNSDFRLLSGASFRMVLDVGNWDSSRVINTPGQSGDPRNPHYRDLVSDWEAGRYVPLLYTRAAVEAETRQRIRLQPQR